MDRKRILEDEGVDQLQSKHQRYDLQQNDRFSKVDSFEEDGRDDDGKLLKMTRKRLAGKIQNYAKALEKEQIQLQEIHESLTNYYIYLDSAIRHIRALQEDLGLSLVRRVGIDGISTNPDGSSSTENIENNGNNNNSNNKNNVNNNDHEGDTSANTAVKTIVARKSSGVVASVVGGLEIEDGVEFAVDQIIKNQSSQGWDYVQSLLENNQKLLNWVVHIVEQAEADDDDDEETVAARWPSSDSRAATMKKALDNLHNRFRFTENKIAEIDEFLKSNNEEQKALQDQIDDVNLEISQRRNQIIRLKFQIDKDNSSGILLENNQEPKHSSSLDMGARSNEDFKQDSLNASRTNGPGSVSAIQKENEELKNIAEQRLTDLKEALHQRKLEMVCLEHAKLHKALPTQDTILKSEIYQIMETKLGPYFLENKKNHDDAKKKKETFLSTLNELQQSLEEKTKAFAEKIESLNEKYKVEFQKAEHAKASRDRLSLRYESRKLDAGIQERATFSEELLRTLQERNAKLEERNKRLVENHHEIEKEYKTLKKAVSESLEVKEEELQEYIGKQREQSDEFIGNIESLSNFYSDLEAHKATVTKVLVEKEESLAKLMAERLKQRQQMINIKEENKSLVMKYNAEEEQINSDFKSYQTLRKMYQKVRSDNENVIKEIEGLSKEIELCEEELDQVKSKLHEVSAQRQESCLTRDDTESRVNALSSMLESLEEETRQFSNLKKLEKKKEEEYKTEVDASIGEQNMDETLEMLRKKVYCSIVTDQPKEVVLIRCGHLFSKQCANDLIAGRNRKCPACGERFGQDDVRNVYY